MLRARSPVVGLLVAASLVNLPVVYRMVRDAPTDAALVLGVGFVSMGLAWAAGFHVQGKRPRLVQVLTLPGIAEAAIAFAPAHASVRILVLVSAGLSLAALALAMRARA